MQKKKTTTTKKKQQKNNKFGSLTGCSHRQSAMSTLLAVLEVNFENDALVSDCFN